MLAAWFNYSISADERPSESLPLLNLGQRSCITPRTGYNRTVTIRTEEETMSDAPVVEVFFDYI